MMMEPVLTLGQARSRLRALKRRGRLGIGVALDTRGRVLLVFDTSVDTVELSRRRAAELAVHICTLLAADKTETKPSRPRTMRIM